MTNTTIVPSRHIGTSSLPPPTAYGPVTFDVPARACCTHAHIVPLGDYPMVNSRSYTPAAAPLDGYLKMLDALGLDRGVLVQLSVFGTDNSAMLTGLDAAPDRLRGIAVLDASVSDRELDELHTRGVRGLRFNVLIGGGVGLEDMRKLAPRMAKRGWHAELLIDGESMLPAVIGEFKDLGCPLMLDHMANIGVEHALDHPATQAMMQHLSRPDGWVNISGAYRIADDIQDARLVERVRALYEIAPDRLVWASDWPHVGRAEMPDAAEFLSLLAKWFPSAEARKKILVDNPARLYSFD